MMEPARPLGFTFLNLVLFCLPGAPRRVAYAAMWGVGASFYAAPLLDPSVFERMRARMGVGRIVFHAANALLHAAPVVCCRVPIEGRHGVAAVAWHLGWGYAVSDGTLCLDRVYEPMRAVHWKLLWGVAVVTEGVVGLVLP